MKFKKINLLITLMFFYLINPSFSQDITLTNGEYIPFLSEYIDSNGIGSHIVSEAFKATGINVNYIFFPWTRSLLSVKSGHYIGGILWRKTPEREKYLFFSDPVIENKFVIFFRKETKITVNNMDDLKDLKLGVTQDYSYNDEFDKKIRQGFFNIETANSDLLNMRKLAYGRIDAFICDLDVGMHLINNYFRQEQINLFVYDKTPLFTDDLRIIISKKDPDNIDLIKKFNSGLKIIKQNGKFNKMITDFNKDKYRPYIVIKIATGEFPPYSSVNLDKYGFISDIISRSFNTEKIHVDYKFFPWKQALELAKTGDLDGTSVWVRAKDKEKDFLISDPIIKTKNVIFYRKNMNFDWNKLEDLKKYKIGATESYSYIPLLKKANLKFKTAPTDLDNFKKLLNGEIDVFPCVIDVGLYILSENFSILEKNKITFHDNPVYVTNDVLLFSKKNPKNHEFLEKFNLGLDKLKINGIYNKLLFKLRKTRYKK